MKFIITYLYAFLTDGIVYILWLFPVYVLCRLSILRHRKRTALAFRVSPSREIVSALLFVYLIMLFTQTFIENDGENIIQWQPFYIIALQISNIRYGILGWKSFLFNVLGNIAVFIPIGMMTTYLFQHNFIRAMCNGILLSLFIETVQIPLERTTDIDDVILNTAGTIIGYLLYKITVSAIKKRAVKKR